MGKNKPSYTPFLDTGDHVIVVNAAKVRLTGRKDQQKVYRRHSGYPGGLTEVGATKMRAPGITRHLRSSMTKPSRADVPGAVVCGSFAGTPDRLAPSVSSRSAR